MSLHKNADQERADAFCDRLMGKTEEKGAVGRAVGTAVGQAAGGAIGGRFGNAAAGSQIGGNVGGHVGDAAGDYMTRGKDACGECGQPLPHADQKFAQAIVPIARAAAPLVASAAGSAIGSAMSSDNEE